MRGNAVRNWWVALAMLACIGQVMLAIAFGLEDRGFGGTLAAAGGLLMLGGLAWRRRARVAGDVVIAVGALPLVPVFWLVVPTLLGLVVIVAAILDAADALSLGRSGEPMGDGRRIGLVAGVTFVASALAAVLALGGPLALVLAAVAAVLAGLVAWVSRRRPRRAV